MGTSSKSKTSSNSTTNSTTRNERNETVSSSPFQLEAEDVEDDLNTTAITGTTVGKDGEANITVTDQGAVQSAFDVTDTITGRAFSFGRDALSRVTNTAQAAAQQASINMRTAVDAVRDTVSEQNETQQVIKGVAVVGTVIAAGIYLIGRSR